MSDYRFPAEPPKEALEFFRRKGLKPSFNWRDVWREEHVANFTVAKAMRIDVLMAIRDEVDRALAEGRPFAQFRKDLTPRLQEMGWWGEGRMQDPLDQKQKRVVLGSPRRLKVIYSTNMRTARAAGQWERIERTKAALPYLLYELGPSEKHRPEHVSWAGLLLPVDDPFWKTHMPANGWGCKCRVRQVSKAEYARLSSSGNYNLKAPPIQTREWVNKRSGEVMQVPAGIDPGWDYNAGMVSRASRSLDMLSDKLQASDASISAALLRVLPKTEGFSAWYARPDGAFPIARMEASVAALIGSKRQVVQISPETAVKQAREHADLTPAEYVFVQAAIDDGLRIQDGDRSLVFLLEQVGYVAVVKATFSGKALFLTSFRRLSSQAAKRDRELQRLKRKGEGKEE